MIGGLLCILDICAYKHMSKEVLMNSRVIVVTSGKGGVGKTTLTANLGRRLASLGQNVALLDTDLGLNNLDILMNIETKVVYDIVDVIEGRCRLAQALVSDAMRPNLKILPGAHSYDKSKITGQNIKLVVVGMQKMFDYILIDCPAGIELGFHRAVSAASEALVVTTPHISAMRDADKAITLLKSYALSNIGLVVNRARGDLEATGETLPAKEIADLLKTELVAVIPDDDAVGQLSNFAVSTSRSMGMDAIDLLARNVHFGSRKILDVSSKYKGLFGMIKRNFKRMG